MKKLLCLLLALCLVLSLPACREDRPSLKKPVNFYFPRVTPTYGTADGFIAAVPSEGAGYQDDPVGLLNFYFEGPSDVSFRNAFPVGAQLLSLSVTDGVAQLQVNKTFAQLYGLNLTIACACLTMTVLDLTGADSVVITARHANLDGQNQIVMDRSCLTLLDQYTPETT